MIPLDWKLVEIWSHYGRLLDNLNTWRKSQGRVFSPAIATIKAMPENHEILTKFHEQDKKYNTLTGRHQGWHYTTGAALLALQWLYRGKVLELHKANALHASKTWQMLNCQPSGGHWIADRFEPGYIGKHCHSPLCPWCYLREFNAHVERIRIMFMPNKRLREATVYLFKACPEPVKELRNADSRMLQVYIGNKVRRKLTTPAYRLMGYPYIVGRNKSVLYSMRIGYFTSKPLGWGEFSKNVKVKGEIRQIHFEDIPDIWIDHGIRHVWPYPVDLLRAPCATVVNYLEFRKRRRDFGVLKAPRGAGL